MENILAVSRENAETLVYKKADVNRLIENLLPIFTEKYKDHKFATNFDKNLPFARLDEDKFQQIMTNLIDNGGKYSEADTCIEISTAIRGNLIVIKVKDEGVGIKKEDYDKLFKKFSRIENHLTSKTQGNGLGLYITKQLVEKMGGQISVSSRINEGTEFQVLFPIYDSEEALKCSQKS